MASETNFYSALYADNKQEPTTAPETIAQDEAIGKPWTHRFTIYCANPSKEFLAELKKNECIVAVYEKTKESAKDDAPSNKK